MEAEQHTGAPPVEVESPKSAPAREETARAAGRGGLAIAGAKVSFIVFGFAQQLVLPRLLGVDGYGKISLVLALVSLVNNVIVATSIQGVSRAISSAPEGRADEAFRRTLGVHVALAMVVSTAFALAAGTIADLEGAPHLASPLRLVGAVVLLYGIYAPLVGSLNGRRRFLAQAGLDVGYGALRLVAVVGGAFFFLRRGDNGVFGAAAGFVAAATIIVPVAMFFTGIGKRARTGDAPIPSMGDYIGYLLPLGVSQIFLNLLMQTDLILLRRFAGQAAETPAIADTLLGVYRGAQLFSFLPYQLLMSITFILFPMLAKAQAEGDRAAVRDYTRTGVRLALILTGLMCGAVSATAPHLLRVVFPEEIWSQGGDALRILSLGMGAFSVLGILSAAFSSLGRPHVAAILTAIAVALIAGGSWILVPNAPVGPDMLVRSAIATSVALTITVVVAGLLLAKLAGGLVAPATLVRVLLATGVTVAVGSRLPWIGKVGTIGEVIAVAALYVVVLVLSREVGRDDLRRVQQVAGRRG